MRIAIAQLNVRAGDIDNNLVNMKMMIDQAKHQGADLIIFPEMCIGGYLISDRYLQKEFTELLLNANEIIKSWSNDIGIIWGNLYTIKGGKANRDGRTNRFNAAYFAYDQQWVDHENLLMPGIYLKHCLPDYRFFDDSRYFKSGLELNTELNLPKEALISPFIFKRENKSLKIGMEVCEDLWSKDYQIDPTLIYAKHGVDLIINISSSPWTLNKELSRIKRIREHQAQLDEKMVKILYVNACGMQNTGKNVLLFDGDSTLYNESGEIQVEANDAFEQELLVFKLTDKIEAKKQDSKLLKGLLIAIKEFDKQILGGQMPWIIGMSGGIDSSLNTVLLVKALGAKRVIGYNMASRYNSDQTKNIAKELAETLGIEYHEGSIEILTKATNETLSTYALDPKEDGLPYENIQARLRGHLLGSFAAYKGGVVCNNGNKVELALGYATLYGDTIGALSILGDLTKVQIFDLCKTVNTVYGVNLIDPSLIGELKNGRYVFGLVPSAELKENQIDPMKWGYHDWLVQYLTEYPSHYPISWLKAYQDGSWKKTPVHDAMVSYGLDRPKAFAEDMVWFMKAWQKAIFKRIQFPPIITVSRGSFGFDYRESQLPYLEQSEVKELLDEFRGK
jgi:NAD+ synthase (glutamine-hydrolysing)